MGGAGHLHPWRLVFSAVAWGAASAQALALLLPERSSAILAPIVLVLLAAALAALYPATPFFYREAAGGCVVVFPSDVCLRLLETAGVDPAPRPIDLEALGHPADPAGADAAARGGESPAYRDERPR
jgi:hypothetical protein